MDSWLRHGLTAYAWTYGKDIDSWYSQTNGIELESWYKISTPELHTYERAEYCPHAFFKKIWKLPRKTNFVQPLPICTMDQKQVKTKYDRRDTKHFNLILCPSGF